MPSSIPQAAENKNACSLTFTILPKLTHNLQCSSSCTSDSQCPTFLTSPTDPNSAVHLKCSFEGTSINGFIVTNPGGSGVCRNPSCSTNADCICSTPAPGACDSACSGSVNPPLTCNKGLQCYYAQSSSNGLTVSNPGAPGVCRSASCLTNPDCTCTTASPTASPTPTGTASPGPSATPNSCGGTCGSDANCLSQYYFCYQGFCRDRSCPNQADCTCPGTTRPTPTETGIRSTATPAAVLPSSGTDWPTVTGAGIGIFVIIGSLLLAL